MRENETQLVSLDFCELTFRQFMFGQEWDFATLNHECVLSEIDIRLVTFEHVESKQQVDVFALAPSRERQKSVKR